MAETLIIAHRGASRQAPENTLPAIEAALEAGADVVALDLQGSQDHVPLVLADNRLDRTTNGAGLRASQLTAKEVQALDAGSWFAPNFKGASVPTLAEALKVLGKRARLLLLFPEVRSEMPLLQEALKALKGRAKPGDDLMLFPESEGLKAFRALAPEFGCALALGEKIEGWMHLEKAARLGLKVVRPFRAQINSDLVRKAHAKGICVYAHFADEESEMKDLLGMRVDGIVTGRPAQLKKMLGGH